MHYTPATRGKNSKPFIEGEAELSGSTRKASVGIVGPNASVGMSNYNQSIMLPKEFEVSDGQGLQPKNETDHFFIDIDHF